MNRISTSRKNQGVLLVWIDQTCLVSTNSPSLLSCYSSLQTAYCILPTTFSLQPVAFRLLPSLADPQFPLLISNFLSPVTFFDNNQYPATRNQQQFFTTHLSSLYLFVRPTCYHTFQPLVVIIPQSLRLTVSSSHTLPIFQPVFLLLFPILNHVFNIIDFG